MEGTDISGELLTSEGEGAVLEAFKMAFREFFEDADVKEALNRIESGQLDKSILRDFFAQRLLVTGSFEALLKGVIQTTTVDGLREAVRRNLEDETGTVQGVVQAEQAHSTWRRNFLQALGTDDTMQVSQNEGTKAYLQIMEALIERADPFEMAGALLFLEGQIPREFISLKKGRDALFGQELEGNLEAKRYLDDHIVHDAKAHFPDLLRALKSMSEAELAQIKKGIQAAKSARAVFYKGQNIFQS